MSRQNDKETVDTRATETVVVSFRLDADDCDRLDALADLRGVSRARYMADVTSAHLASVYGRKAA